MSAERRAIDIELHTPENSLNEYHFGPSKDSPQLEARIQDRLKDPMTEDAFFLHVRDMIEYTGGKAQKEKTRGIRLQSEFGMGEKYIGLENKNKRSTVSIVQRTSYGAVSEKVYVAYDDPTTPPQINRVSNVAQEIQSITGEMIQVEPGISERIDLDPKDLHAIAENILDSYRESLKSSV
jgi:hypothetical protein